MATGGVNTFDVNMAKFTQAKTEILEQIRSRSKSVNHSNQRRRRNQLARDHLGRKSEQTYDNAKLLAPGEGLLIRAQRATRTKFGRPIQLATITKLTTVQEQEAIRSRPTATNNVKIILTEPFNQISVVTELLGLTGAGGIVKERFEQFPRPVGCVINVSYEVPLLKVPGIESFRVPVDDDRKEDLFVYFDEVVETMFTFQTQGKATIVHCMAGVSRSATFIIG